MLNLAVNSLLHSGYDVKFVILWQRIQSDYKINYILPPKGFKEISNIYANTKITDFDFK